MRFAVVLGVLAGCSLNAPPGFSPGDRWTFPLVDPLANGMLVTPVIVNGHGPYLFAIAPDADLTIDERVALDAGLRTDKGFTLRPYDEDNHPQVRFRAEVLGLQIGDLIVERRAAMLVPNGTFDAYGRDLHGVIGRQVIAESLVFGFDRDKGIAFLETQGAFHEPPGAHTIHWDWFFALHRMLASVQIGGGTYQLHVDLGATESSLVPAAWDRAGLRRGEQPSVRLDRAGTVHRSTEIGIAPAVTAGGATTRDVAFAPQNDRRIRGDEYDGRLGLDFFAPYDVWLSWDKQALYLTPRAASPETDTIRFARWGAPVSSCPHRGCVTIKVIDPLAGQAPAPGAAHPGVVLAVERDPGSPPLEVTLAPSRPDLPKLVANLPAGVDRVMDHLDARYVGAQLSVVDVSPFPLACPTVQGCVLAAN